MRNASITIPNHGWYSFDQSVFDAHMARSKTSLLSEVFCRLDGDIDGRKGAYRLLGKRALAAMVADWDTIA